MEKIIETKICQCWVHFEITEKDMEFYDKISPVFAWTKYQIPSPTLCPECRNQRRLAWRNRRNMYRRTCDASGKNIISMFSPDKPYKVYHVKDFEWDKWDAKEYAKEFDFSRPFFEQFDELLKSVPLPHLAVIESELENADYVNWAHRIKNSYLSNNMVDCENIYYSEDIYWCKNVIDSLSLKASENCYECINSHNIYNSKYLFECENCRDSIYSKFCKWCSSCIWCINLTNKEYHIFNVAYSKEEYAKIASSLTESEIKSKASDLAKKVPYKFAKIIESENAIWDNIVSSKDIKNSFDIYDSENINHSIFVMWHSKDCYDITFWWENLSLCYDSAAIWINCSKLLFSSETYDNVNNSFYCYFCYPNNSELFGCVSLKNSKYCILNKQYSKEEYEALVPKIIEHMKKNGEWWEFFPVSISPFGYNETVWDEYYPLSRKEADKNGFKWSTYESPLPAVSKIIPWDKLPIDINEIPDDILNWAIECENTNKPFRIIKQELDFYRKFNLPIPKLHPDERHKERVKQRNPRKLYDRNCDKCWVEIVTSYAPERPEIVYCESCYNKEID